MFTRMKIGGLGLDSSNLSRHPSYEYIQQSKGTALNNADINTQLSYDPEDMGLRLDSDDDVVHSSDDEDENSQLLRDCQSNSIHANNRKYLNKLRSPSPQPNYRSSKSDTMAKTSSNPSRKKDPNRDPYNNSIYFNPNGENENDEVCRYVCYICISYLCALLTPTCCFHRSACLCLLYLLLHTLANPVKLSLNLLKRTYHSHTLI